MAKPLLRWAGSKRQLVKRLAQYWPGGNIRYVEPFAGSACLFFELEPFYALLGDINFDLIKMYEIVRKSPHDLHRSLSRWNNDRTEYYRVREMIPSKLSDIDRSARFIYLNRFCFNGLYRTNGSGHFNVPYGGGRSGSIPSLELLDMASRLLSRSRLISGDFEEVLQDVRSTDFVYLDPPFSMTERRSFTEYAPEAFGERDMMRLRATIERLDELGATFLLSYADCDEGKKLAKGFRTYQVETRRSIAGFSGSRQSVIELIVTNTVT